MLLSSYLLYSEDALIRALLDQASAISTDEEITAEGMGHYAQAHSILWNLILDVFYLLYFTNLSPITHHLRYY